MPLTRITFMLACYKLFSASDIQWQNKHAGKAASCFGNAARLWAPLRNLETSPYISNMTCH